MNGLRIQKETWHYSAIHAFFWMAYCAGTGFSSTYLLEIGFKNSQIGILVACAGICAAVLQPLLAGIIDRSGKRMLKPVLYCCIFTAVGLSLLILILPESMYAAAGLCFGGNLMILQIMIPLINSLCICSAGKGRIDFGFSRAIGSLTYAGLSWALGILIAKSGMPFLSVMRILSFAGLAGCIYAFPVRFQSEGRKRQAGNKRGKTGRGNRFLSRYPGFLILMAGCFLLYFCHSFLTYYNYQIVLSKGGDKETYGVVIALAAMLELPVMFFFTGMLRRMSAARWFCLSGAGYILKALGCLMTVNMAGYYMVQIFQMTAWALISVASVTFVKEVIPQEDAIQGQAYLTLSYTAAMAAGSLTGGFLLQLVSIRIMLLTAVLCAVAGTVILTAGVRKCLSDTSS